MCDRDERIRRTVASYDESATAYAAASRSYEFFPGLKDAIRDFEAWAPLGVVLDAGCGAGRDATFLAGLGRQVLALDLSRRLLGTWTNPPGTVVLRVVGDLAKAPIRPRSLAGIWACASLLHQPPSNLPVAISNLVELVAPGGVIATSFRLTGLTGWWSAGAVAGERWLTALAPEELCAVLVGAGLHDVCWRQTGQDWYMGWGFARSDQET